MSEEELERAENVIIDVADDELSSMTDYDKIELIDMLIATLESRKDDIDPE